MIGVESNGLAVSAALDLTELRVHPGGRAQTLEDPSALFGCPYRSTKQRAVHALEGVRGQDLGRELLVEPGSLPEIERDEDVGPIGEVLVEEGPAHTGSIGHRLD